ncbi:protein hinderin isoform X4 [Boleophthalmus pectinirostris]|uniref:protein hinderin isoform X4 n=1 Tax=Boleophthalmus pectinirostris TaxID=150288 RepID=UPI00242B7F94|nr:protein hinderin isoform X4 [Boleophthalmus pectinirostris]
MAAVTTNPHKTGIFWMENVTDEEQPLVFVSGLNRGAPFVSGPHGTEKRGTRPERTQTQAVRGRSGGQKPRHRERSGGSSSEKVPVSAPDPEDRTSRGPSAFLSPSQMERQRSQVSLKDLCPEDKKRIANLIQELARVSEEQELSAQRFTDEQGQFEQKILELEEQNLIIAEERESLQQQYRECQELLELYQVYLKDQQHRLDSQVRAQEEQEASRCSSHVCAGNASVCDGSYLGLAPPPGRRAHYRPPARPAPVPLPPNHHQHPHLTTTHQPVHQNLHPTADPPPQQVHAPPPPVVPVSCESCERHRPRRHDPDPRPDPRPDPGPDSGYETQPLNNTCNKHQRSTETCSSPGLGSQDWDQRKNQLLMQKIQLEQERERLQRRLSEQEKRSRKETPQTNGFSEAEFSSEPETRLTQPQGPPASSRRLRHTEEKKKTETHVPETEHSTGETSSRRDVGTSPGPSSSARPEPRPLASPQTRLDLSLSELLEIFSPACPGGKQSSATRRPKAALRPPRSCGPAPSRSHASLTPLTSDPDLELEESRILEDIFFIL